MLHDFSELIQGAPFLSFEILQYGAATKDESGGKHIPGAGVGVLIFTSYLFTLANTTQFVRNKIVSLAL